MKRCNNCGWFNLDTATRCEKCDDDSLELHIETPTEPEQEKPVIATPIVQLEEPKQMVEETPARPNMMATVSFGASPLQEPKVEESATNTKRNHLAATVMDVSNVLEAETSSVQCPKCCYPIAGYMEYCPNCGTTIKKRSAINETAKEEQTPQPQPQSILKKTITIGNTHSLKETIRDIPENLVDEKEDCYLLVPVDSIGDASIELHLGQIVNIGGRNYKFQK